MQGPCLTESYTTLRGWNYEEPSGGADMRGCRGRGFVRLGARPLQALRPALAHQQKPDSLQQIGRSVHALGQKNVGRRIVIIDADLARDQDRWRVRRQLLDPGDQLRAIEAGHRHVGDDQINPAPLEALQGFLAAGETGHAIAACFQHDFAMGERLLVVVHTQYGPFRFHPSSAICPAAVGAHALSARSISQYEEWRSERNAKRIRRGCKVPPMLMGLFAYCFFFRRVRPRISMLSSSASQRKTSPRMTSTELPPTRTLTTRLPSRPART